MWECRSPRSRGHAHSAWAGTLQEGRMCQAACSLPCRQHTPGNTRSWRARPPRRAPWPRRARAAAPPPPLVVSPPRCHSAPPRTRAARRRPRRTSRAAAAAAPPRPRPRGPPPPAAVAAGSRIRWGTAEGNSGSPLQHCQRNGANLLRTVAAGHCCTAQPDGNSWSTSGRGPTPASTSGTSF